jgi:dTDP-L-rhamnose 4-epimerase
MKKILITGGAGFIGSNLALALIESSYEVTVLDNLSTQIHGDNPEKTSPLFQSIIGKVNFIEGTVTSKEDLKKAISDNEIIVHFAAETGTGQSMYQIEHYTTVNIGGTALMLDILANTKHQVKKIIVASSRALYGEGKYFSKDFGIVYPNHRLDEDMINGDFEVKFKNSISPLEILPTDEESKIHPSSVYGITKQNQEQLVMTVCPTIGIAAVSLRYQNVYGPGQSLSNPYTGILSIFSSLIKQNKAINIFEDGNESRDFVYISDVINATILAIEKDEANDDIFNVGTGVPINVKTVVNELINLYGISVPVKISGNYRLGDIRHNFADLNKINVQLGFTPKVYFSEGIKQFTNWVNTQSILGDTYQESINEMKEKGLLK